MNTDLIVVLTFLIVLIIIFWMMPNQKITAIGDFFAKILMPISIFIGGLSRIKKIRKILKNDKS